MASQFMTLSIIHHIWGYCDHCVAVARFGQDKNLERFRLFDQLQIFKSYLQ